MRTNVGSWAGLEAGGPNAHAIAADRYETIAADSETGEPFLASRVVHSDVTSTGDDT